VHLLGDLGLHLAERGGLLLHLLEAALHLVEFLQLRPREKRSVPLLGLG
jgi:hypothetical protein